MFHSTQTQRFILIFMACLSCLLSACGLTAPTPSNRAEKSQITVIYDAFGKDASVKKDWGYAALIEVGGRRILFDTGNDAETFAHNVKAKGIDLTNLDFVVLSHRHGDHMAGLSRVIEANPKVKIYAPKEGFGVYGGSLPRSFYRKNEQLPPEMRYFDGKPPQTMVFGSAWEKANFELIDKTTQVAPGVWLISQVSDAVGTRELKELSLAIDTPDGVILIVGCSHPGIENIVQEVSKINPKIQWIAGGLHMVGASDEAVLKVSQSLRDTYRVQNIAPGHCTGEPTFAGLQQAFGRRYFYAGVGTVLNLSTSDLASRSSSNLHATPLGEDLIAYRTWATTSHDAWHMHASGAVDSHPH